MEQIVTENLYKSYKEVRAVNDLNLSVKKGEIYGFLGLNGAGKTTTIRMLLGLIKPSGGSAWLNGIKVKPNNSKLWEKVGYLVEVPHAYPQLTVRENLKLIAQLRNINNSAVVDKIISDSQLNAYADRKFKYLSLGNRQRLGLARALIHQPEILLLDEPANGLDPAGIHDVRNMLTDLALNQGVTIFVSSHILSEISMVASRIGIIHKGFMIDEIQTSELPLLCDRRLVIQTSDTERDFKIVTGLGYNDSVLDSDRIIIRDEKAIKERDKIARKLVSLHLNIKKLNVEQESLESYFLKKIAVN